MIPLLLSFKAIYSLIPIILIVLLIAAAAGLTRGADLFSFLGFGALMGFSSGLRGGKRTGLTGKKYAGGRGALKRIGRKGRIFGKGGALSIKSIRGLAAARNAGAGGAALAVDLAASRIAKTRINAELAGAGTGSRSATGRMGRMVGTATPVETQFARFIREKIANKKEEKKMVEKELAKARELEETGKAPKVRVLKGAIYTARLRNGKVVAYKMATPYKFLKYVPLFGGIVHAVGRSYSSLRSISPHYAMVYGEKFDEVKLRSEELKEKRRVLNNQTAALNVELFKEQQTARIGKEKFDEIWKDSREKAKGTWFERAGRLSGEDIGGGGKNTPPEWQKARYNAEMYGSTIGAVSGLKAAYNTYKRLRGGGGNQPENLRAPGRGGAPRGSSAWTTMHVRNVEAMQRAALRFGQTKDRLEREMEELRAARATAQTLEKKRLIRAKLKAAAAEHKYVSKVLTDVEKGTGQDIMTSFKLALRGETVRGRKGAPKLAELKRRAKPEN
jgi:hypothetical protein